MTFDLPIDQDYHLIAYEPLIDNAEVLHHILLYGCKNPNGELIENPKLCGMNMNNDDCSEIIGAWAVGNPGDCLPVNLGFRFGRSGYKRVKMETHYNNPKLRHDFTDSSGLKIYYQPSMSQMADLGILVAGQRLLEIPPGLPRVELVGICGGDCTRRIITKPAYIIRAVNHMHYLGRAMSIQIYRDGQLYKTATNEDFYSYDTPVQFDQDPFIELMPGDEIKTTCVYNTMSSKRWTYFGDATSDEMCVGFMTFYPKDALLEGANCMAIGPLDGCSLMSGKPIGQCNWKQFINKTDPETIKLWAEVEKNCNTNGFCRPECRKIITTVKNHPCFSGEAKAFVYNMLESSKDGFNLLARLSSCGDVKVCPTCEEGCLSVAGASHVADGARGMTVSMMLTIFLTSFVIVL